MIELYVNKCAVFVCFVLLLSCEKQETSIGLDEKTKIEESLSTFAVNKSNKSKVYVHYMPWFESKEFSGNWGYHWTMNSRNPDQFDDSQNRQIAAHFYPLIGPYDSQDADVIEYHLLLMKYSGIDGVLIDWYGSFSALDYRINLENANALIENSAEFGLEFAIVYEEYTAEHSALENGITPIEAAQTDLNYIVSNYLVRPNYIRFGQRPLLLVFGPRLFTSEPQWSQILSAYESTFSLMPLWNFSSFVGSGNVSGEFGWIDFKESKETLIGFYQSTPVSRIIGSVYPGFHDYYSEAGIQPSFGYIAHQNGSHLKTLLDLSTTYELPVIQLNTWNDFGEGTMIEPTDEFGFHYLELVQQFTGVSYTDNELALIHRLFQLRKQFKLNVEVQKRLDEVSMYLKKLDVAKATEVLDNL